MIKTTEDKYKGITIDSTSLPESVDVFKEELTQLIASLENKNLIWMSIPIEKSEYIPVLTKLGFEFHHCEERKVMLVKKLAHNTFIPTTKNFIVGVGAIVLRGKELLVIKDRFNIGYKLPGGHVDKNESIKNALKREVYEETGVAVEFESIVNIGHFKNGQFGESNLYIACTAKLIDATISIHDKDEIIDARWMNVDEFLNNEEVNNYNKSVVKAATTNKELKLIEQHVKLRFGDSEVFF